MNKLDVGYFSGLLYIIITTIGGIVLLTSNNYIKYNELSTLGVNAQTSTLFNLLVILNGIFLFLYYSFYLKLSRSETRGKHWKLVVFLGQLGAVGQIFLGVFPNTPKLHYYHFVSATLFFSMSTFSLFLYSYDLYHMPKLQNYIRKSTNIIHKTISPIKKFYIREIKTIYLLAMFILIYAVLYPSVLRPINDQKGIWQIVFVIFLIIWHIRENIMYRRIIK